MGNDGQDAVLALSNATVVLRADDQTRRFRVHAAVLTRLPGDRHVRLRFEGPQGSVAVEMPRVAFWRLTALFHERSIAAQDASRQRRAWRTRGKRA